MKNKHSFWIACFTSIVGFASFIGLTGCQPLKSDFYYSPTTPCAGQSVTFYNKSTGADDYYWNFGDNCTSTTTSPSHIFYKPGTYTVTLQIVRNKVEKKSYSQQVTVIDTVPTITYEEDSVLYTYTPMTFKVNVFNPWKKQLTYHWHLPNNAVVLKWGTDSATVQCYFTQEATNCNIQVDFTQGDKTYALSCTDTIYHLPSSSVLYRANGLNYEQFTYIINDVRLFHQATQTNSYLVAHLLDAENDTTAEYGELLTRDIVSQRVGRPVIGFQIDRLMAKIYAYNNQDGLWVSNINGSNVRTLIPAPIHAIKVDGDCNRLYWATDSGLYTHRLIQLTTNSDTFEPQQVNAETQISCLSVYTDKH